MSITVISDSLRHRYLYETLIQDGFDAYLYENIDGIPDHIESDIIVLPIPSANSNGLINLRGKAILTVENIVSRTKNDALIIGCNFESKNRKCVDINKFEFFTSMNAIPSAEGAILEAMKNSDIPLFGSKTLIIGYGRIGKIIADRMKHFYSDVTVTARNEKDILAAGSVGLNSVDYSHLSNIIKDFDFIFQTVPYPILTENLLIKTNSLIIEISSKCQGTDREFALKNKNNLIYCPGIPEKYSARYAAKILKDSVMKIIEIYT